MTVFWIQCLVCTFSSLWRDEQHCYSLDFGAVVGCVDSQARSSPGEYLWIPRFKE
jgi:hypothetical protein